MLGVGGWPVHGAGWFRAEPEAVDQAAGRDPFAKRPPSNWWIAETRYKLTDDFLTTIADRYLKLGRGYVKTLAAEYSTSPRTVRSWIDKARERGILGPSVGQGKIGAVD